MIIKRMFPAIFADMGERLIVAMFGGNFLHLTISELNATAIVASREALSLSATKNCPPWNFAVILDPHFH
ncbi:MAG: hypothetical protein M0033_02780 [Nitrospiraceae bacterium]|nr:hypothetical protein [Nitrospiraceae bacterium]